jgi:hypothetical protein
MESDIHKMARRFYGYGSWDAPYWFIGPEPGQARAENNDLRPRAKAWLDLGGGELIDCHAFHDLIFEKRWHGVRPRLQSTWRPLMLCLMPLLKMPWDNNSLRVYQRDQWGKLSGGETCVIELSGLAANSSKQPRERDLFRQDRVEVIRHRMLTHKPSVVVMYGQKSKKHWEEIARSEFPPDGILRLRSTTLAFVPHPTHYGSKNEDWVKLGMRLRQEVKPS